VPSAAGTVRSMRAAPLLFLLVAATAGAADVARLQRQIDAGNASERVAALRELKDADPAAAVATAIVWLQPGSDVALATAAARVLWDLELKSAPAEAALRARLDDPNPELVYPVVGALAALGVPKPDLRATRLRLARAPDRFIAFYSARALYPDSALAFDDYLRASFGAIELVATGRPSNAFTRNDLERDAKGLLDRLARQGGRPGFEALMAAYPAQPPRVQSAIAGALDAVPVEDGDPLRIAVLLDDPQLSVQRSVTAALADYHEAAAPVVAKIVAGLQNPDADFRASTASALGRLAGTPPSIGEQQRSSAWRSQVERMIAPALGRVATEDREADVRKEAADALQALGLWGGPALDIIAARVAQEPDPRVRHALVRVCWTARYAPNLPLALLQQLADNDPDLYVRNEAKSVLVARR
jgi:hypothetical protein